MKHQKSVGRSVSCINRNIHTYLHHELEKFGLGSGQPHFLMLLYKRDGVNQETLAEIIKIDKATCARAIKKLIEQGYVTRKRDPLDKRAYNIFLTEKAIDLKPEIKSVLKNCTKQLLSGFSKEEEEIFIGFLERISKNSILLTQQETL